MQGVLFCTKQSRYICIIFFKKSIDILVKVCYNIITVRGTKLTEQLKNMKEVIKMAKMYLQHDNGGYGVLITDGNKWYFWSEYYLPVSLESDTDEENAEIIRKAILNGNMYDADDFITEFNAEELAERHIAAYDGMTIKEIDTFENSKRFCDLTYYTEI